MNGSARERVIENESIFEMVRCFSMILSRTPLNGSSSSGNGSVHHIANDVCKKMTFENPLHRIIMEINLVKCELVLCEDALKHRLACHNFIKIVFACNFI